MDLVSIEPPQETNSESKIEKQENELENTRLYIGGLHESVTREELISRFSSFGKVENPFIPISNIDNKPRGFGYITLVATKKQYQKCISLYSGTKWKGLTMVLEKAKEGYLSRMEKEKALELETAELPNPKKDKSAAFANIMASDMTLVDDKNVDKKRGWKRGRYGRAIAVVKYLAPDGTFKTIDPSVYKNNLEKLFGSIRPKRLTDLRYFYDSDFDDVDFLSDSEPEFIEDPSKTLGFASRKFHSAHLTIDDDHENSQGHENFAEIDQILDNKSDSELQKEQQFHLQLIQSISGSDKSVLPRNQQQSIQTKKTANNSDSDTDIEELYSNVKKFKHTKFSGADANKVSVVPTASDNYSQTEHNDRSGIKNSGFDQQNFKNLFFGAVYLQPTKAYVASANLKMVSLLNSQPASTSYPTLDTQPSFKLFGSANDDDNMDVDSAGVTSSEQTQQLSGDMQLESHNISDNRISYTENKPLFFDHFDSALLFPKSRLYPIFSQYVNPSGESPKVDDDKKPGIVPDFVCTSTEQEIEEYWDKTRLFLTREYKKRLKYAKSQKTRRKMKFNPRRNR